MRRAAVLCVCFFLLLTGCAKKTAAVESEGFSCTAVAKWEDNTYTLFLEALGGGIFKATVSAGEMKGMCFTLDGDTISVSYLGMDYTLPDGFFGQNCVMAIKEVLLSLKRGGEEKQLDAGDVISLDTAMGPAKVTIRPDGFPTKIVLPSADAEIELSDFEYLP